MQLDQVLTLVSGAAVQDRQFQQVIFYLTSDSALYESVSLEDSVKKKITEYQSK